MVVRAKMTVVRATIKERCGISTRGRIEAPSERAVKDAVSGKESEGIEPRIPIPPVSEPAIPTAKVSLRGIGIGFGKVGRPQTSPAIEVCLLRCLFVELLGPERLIAPKINFAPALHFDASASIFDKRLTVKDANRVVVSIKIVQSRLGKIRSLTIFHDPEIILFVNLRHFHHSFTLV